MKYKYLYLPLLGMPLASVQAQSSKPNVIVILADDLGYGDVGAYGATEIKTPNLDRLAHGGVRFTNAYATSATSTPSRYALMTGMYPWKNKEAKILPGDAPLIISESQPTLPKLMKSAGYATAAIGKWHLGMGEGKVNWNQTIRPGAREIGFDFSNIIAATNDRVPTVYVENGDVIGLESDDPIFVNYGKNFEGEPTALSHPELLKMKWSHGHNNSVVNGIPRIGFMKGGTNARWIDEDMADFFLDKVKSFIGDHKDQPFFLYYGLHQPHVPRAPHQRFVGASGMGPRGDAIVEADWCVGALLDYLQANGLLENTLIVFSSDNGPVVDDGYQDQAEELLGKHKPSGVLRGGKYSLFEAGTRVPFIVYWKGTVKPKVSESMVCQMDLMASLAHLTGTPLTGALDSQETLNVLLGKKRGGRTELVTEAMGRLAFRKGDYALIPPYKGAERNITKNELGNLSEWSLFDLRKDVGQTQNLKSKYPKRFEALKADFLRLTSGYYQDRTQ